MATSIHAPQQHKQPSRKGKKAWRKNVDLTEVQVGLEEVREEIIRGGVVSEKPSEELFTLDTIGNSEIQKSYNKVNKPLKADEILAQRSAVPAIDSRKRPADARVTDGIIPAKRRREGGISHKELERLRHIAYHGEAAEKDVIQQNENADHDPWDVQEETKDPRFSFLEKQKPIREPKTLKHAPVSLLANGKTAPAVKKPEGGRSYNPLFSEWEDLVSRAGNKEVEAEEKRLQEERDEEDRLARIAASAAEAEREANGESEWESEWEGIQSEPEDAWLRQKRPVRKTPAERNKIKRRKEAERQKKHEQRMKAKEAQENQIKALAKAVARKEKARKDVAAIENANESDADDVDDEVLRRRKLGKYPIPQARLDIALAEDLTESLRQLRPEGNLVQDRFRSMLVRGKVEARREVQRKKKQVTSTEKWTYKDWKLK